MYSSPVLVPANSYIAADRLSVRHHEILSVVVSIWRSCGHELGSKSSGMIATETGHVQLFARARQPPRQIAAAKLRSYSDGPRSSTLCSFASNCFPPVPAVTAWRTNWARSSTAQNSRDQRDKVCKRDSSMDLAVNLAEPDTAQKEYDAEEEAEERGLDDEANAWLIG